MTVSMGVVSLTARDDLTQLDLINTADGLLYDAKRGGRNQIKETEVVA